MSEHNKPQPRSATTKEWDPTGLRAIEQFASWSFGLMDRFKELTSENTERTAIRHALIDIIHNGLNLVCFGALDLAVRNGSTEAALQTSSGGIENIIVEAGTDAAVCTGDYIMLCNTMLKEALGTELKDIGSKPN